MLRCRVLRCRVPRCRIWPGPTVRVPRSAIPRTFRQNLPAFPERERVFERRRSLLECRYHRDEFITGLLITEFGDIRRQGADHSFTLASLPRGCGRSIDSGANGAIREGEEEDCARRGILGPSEHASVW